jgi:hypothetical protein
VQPRGGPAEMQLLRHGDEVPELTQLHRALIPPSN